MVSYRFYLVASAIFIITQVALECGAAGRHRVLTDEMVRDIGLNLKRKALKLEKSWRNRELSQTVNSTLERFGNEVRTRWEHHVADNTSCSFVDDFVLAAVHNINDRNQRPGAQAKMTSACKHFDELVKFYHGYRTMAFLAKSGVSYTADDIVEKASDICLPEDWYEGPYDNSTECWKNPLPYMRKRFRGLTDDINQAYHEVHTILAEEAALAEKHCHQPFLSTDLLDEILLPLNHFCEYRKSLGDFI